MMTIPCPETSTSSAESLRDELDAFVAAELRPEFLASLHRGGLETLLS